jgi:hypothetical protein
LLLSVLIVYLTGIDHAPEGWQSLRAQSFVGFAYDHLSEKLLDEEVEQAVVLLKAGR